MRIENFKWLVVIVIYLLVMTLGSTPAICGNAPYGHKTIFRYRCFEGSRPSWVSPIDSVGGINHSVGSSDIHVIERGNGFERFLSTDFNGTSEYIRASSAINTTDTEGHDSFTIQAWFLAHNTEDYRCLVSNMYAYKGFSLKINNGQLRGLVRLLDGSSSVSVEIRGGNIEPGNWHYAALRIKENDTTYDIRLFLNGEEVAYITSPHYDGIRQSPERPMVGAEPNNGAAVGDFFDGYIYAVSITNYAVGMENFLLNKAIRDGSRYFGMISYHDYLDTTKGPDHRISRTINDYPDIQTYITRRYYCPFLNDMYVPQGLTTNGLDRVYLAMYWRDKDNHTGTYPSILAELTTDGRLRRVMQLFYHNGQQFTGHAGGAAYWKGFIYVPDDGNVLSYNLAQGSYIFDPETFSNPRGDQNPMYAVGAYDCNLSPNTIISFMSISTDFDGTPVLWNGEFSETENMRIIGFEFLSNDYFDPANQLYNLILPIDNVQGIYCYKATSTHLWFYATRSWSDNPGHIYNIVYEKGNPNCQSYSPVFEGPAGMEDLGKIGADLWCVSESGAKYFQKRTDPAPWEQLFPFVFSCKFSLKGDINADGVVDTLDLQLLCQQWLQEPGEPTADIADTWGDGFVDFRDFTQLGSDWLKSF